MFVLRKIGLSLLALLAVVSSLAETGKVLIRIDGKEVTDTELEAYYSRSPVRSRETPQRYFNHFLFFKLKVADALSMGWDTLPEFKQQYHVLSGEMLKPVLVKRQEMKAFFQHQYQEEKARLLTNTWVRTEFLTLPLSQHPAKAEEDQAQSLMDSAYVALQNGVTFSELTSRYVSQKPQLKGGTMWMPLVGLVPELAERLQNLDEGVVSRPFYSPVGMHIVRLLDRKDGRDFRETYPMLQAYCDRRLDGVPVLNEDLYRAWKNGSSDYPASVESTLQWVRDGLLAAWWDARLGTDKHIQPKPGELENYFKEHKEEYAWDLPHFKGAVIHCQNRKAASKIKKKLKKLPLSEWEKVLSQEAIRDSVYHAELETGLFQIGKNPYVDKLAFKCGSYLPHAELPYTFVLGKRLKKGPEEYQDVLDAVMTDYCEAQKESEMLALKRKFKVEINQDVLKTVNCDGSN